MGERKLRLAYQRQHGGPVPAPATHTKMRLLQVPTTAQFATMLEARYDALAEGKDRPPSFGEYCAFLLLEGVAAQDFKQQQEKELESLIALPTDAQVRKVVAG